MSGDSVRSYLDSAAQDAREVLTLCLAWIDRGRETCKATRPSPTRAEIKALNAAYYNELDAYAVRWLKNLISANHIAHGVVDAGSIVAVIPEAVRHAKQAHFFAGIGVWSAAARAAGWPDETELWSGSCPCQPFSQAGRGRGTEDDRHLWPLWFQLIAACLPPVIVGEQVASPAGLAWLDAVFADLEGAGYTCAAADLCAAGVGAPHIRQRLYFVAIINGERLERVRLQLQQRRSQQALPEADWSSPTGGLAHADSTRLEGRAGGGDGANLQPVGTDGLVSVVADSCGNECSPRRAGETYGDGAIQPSRCSATSGFWTDADWIPCSDGKARPVEPGTFPLVDGTAARVGGLRPLRAPKIKGYGNAIVLPQAKEFIQTVIDLLIAPENYHA